MISHDYTDFSITQLLSRQECDLLSPAARQSDEPFELLHQIDDLLRSDLMKEVGDVVEGRLLLLRYWIDHEMEFGDWLILALRDWRSYDAGF